MRQRSMCLKLTFVQTFTQNRPISLPGPLKFFENLFVKGSRHRGLPQLCQCLQSGGYSHTVTFLCLFRHFCFVAIHIVQYHFP